MGSFFVKTGNNRLLPAAASLAEAGAAHYYFASSLRGMT
ncbi:MAG: hypothetical protein ACI9WS_000232 [Paraglaciecola psychrophila]|jgi:hypothetical protein